MFLSILSLFYGLVQCHKLSCEDNDGSSDLIECIPFDFFPENGKITIDSIDSFLHNS